MTRRGEYDENQQILMHPQIYDIMVEYRKDTLYNTSSFVAFVLDEYIKKNNFSHEILPEQVGVPEYQKKDKRFSFRMKTQQYEELKQIMNRYDYNLSYIVYQAILTYIFARQ